jgi:hypothetical protein
VVVLVAYNVSQIEVVRDIDYFEECSKYFSLFFALPKVYFILVSAYLTYVLK